MASSSAKGFKPFSTLLAIGSDGVDEEVAG